MTIKYDDLKNEVLEELQQGILPFWLRYSKDEHKGGFYGRVDNKGNPVPDAPKGLILNTRILWSFSAAYNTFKNTAYLKTADRAYEYIIEYFIDIEFGGAYWMLDSRGVPIEDKKKVYGHAFLIYALSEYYKAAGKKIVMDQAVSLFNIIEKHFFDEVNGGYLETAERDWSVTEDMRLSAVDMNEKKSMNAHLHILEAYTNLFSIWPDDGLKKQLTRLAEDFLKYIIHSDSGHFNLFFDEAWNVKSCSISPGHDIEGSWLLWETAEILDDPGLKDKVLKAVIKQAEEIYKNCTNPDGSLMYEIHSDGKRNSEKHWWVMSEAMVGFLNAYQLTGDTKYYEAVSGAWEYISNSLIDREYGEWFYKRGEDNSIAEDEYKISEWKGPYHNIRACLEVLKRVENL